MDRVDRPEGRGNAGEAGDSYFHPSRPSEFGCLAYRKTLIRQSKSAYGVGRTPTHLGNPGFRLAACRGAPHGASRITAGIANLIARAMIMRTICSLVVGQ